MHSSDPSEAPAADEPSGSLEFAERIAQVLRGMLSKTQEAFTRLHEMMLPSAEAPKDFAGLVDAFHSNDEAIRGFSYTQTERGVCSFLAVALAHGIKVDFEAITTKYPVDADERPKSTRKHTKTAARLASQFSELIRAREAEKAKIATKKSSAPSESGVA